MVVKTINSRKVYITGNVVKPGTYPLNGDMSVLQLIAVAGGLQEYADSKKIVVMRKDEGRDRVLQLQLQGRGETEERAAEHRVEARRHGGRAVSVPVATAIVTMLAISGSGSLVYAQARPSDRPYRALFGRGHQGTTGQTSNVSATLCRRTTTICLLKPGQCHRAAQSVSGQYTMLQTGGRLCLVERAAPVGDHGRNRIQVLRAGR